MNNFLINKYTGCYLKLITKAKERNWSKKTAPCYTEEHHIIPKSCGGSNKKENLVRLTAKEHFISHLLLTKMYVVNSQEHASVIRAFWLLCNRSKIKNINKSSRIYVYGRESFAKINFPSPSNLEKLKLANTGRVHTNIARQKMAKAHRKNWKFINPEGDVIIIKNLIEYCKDNNLHHASLCKVAKKQLKHYKGWRKFSSKLIGIKYHKKDFSRKLSTHLCKWSYTIKNINSGKIHRNINHIIIFCDKYNINKDTLAYSFKSRKPNQEGFIITHKRAI